VHRQNGERLPARLSFGYLLEVMFLYKDCAHHRAEKAQFHGKIVELNCSGKRLEFTKKKKT